MWRAEQRSGNSWSTDEVKGQKRKKRFVCYFIAFSYSLHSNFPIFIDFGIIFLPASFDFSSMFFFYFFCVKSFSPSSPRKKREEYRKKMFMQIDSTSRNVRSALNEYSPISLLSAAGRFCVFLFRFFFPFYSLRKSVFFLFS